MVEQKKKNNPKNIQTKIIRFFNLENDSSLFIYVYKKIIHSHSCVIFCAVFLFLMKTLFSTACI